MHQKKTVFEVIANTPKLSYQETIHLLILDRVSSTRTSAGSKKVYTGT